MEIRLLQANGISCHHRGSNNRHGRDDSSAHGCRGSRFRNTCVPIPWGRNVCSSRGHHRNAILRNVTLRNCFLYNLLCECISHLLWSILFLCKQGLRNRSNASGNNRDDNRKGLRLFWR